MTHILVATDAWHPQVNGVVRTLTMVAEAARGFGAEFSFITPDSFRTVGMPSYRDVRLALPRPAKIARLIAEAEPDAIHIATEGPIGVFVRRPRGGGEEYRSVPVAGFAGHKAHRRRRARAGGAGGGLSRRGLSRRLAG